ncbi:hypothetical protein C8J57DRAFT_50958 [Mycena rebaudengoi]|nr:hypothetical protein C8J57DRAFT_50958 [Mycena rebaudengoi]
MPDSQGFSAWISIDGVRSSEFDVQDSDSSRTVSCWIPSEVGKKFSVHWSNLSVSGPTGGRVLVDGNNCHGQVLARPGRPTSTRMDGINQSPTSLLPFLFTALNLTDDDVVLEDNLDDRLGTIVLEIYKVEMSKAGPSKWSDLAPPPPKQLHERSSKKAATQQISFCPPVARQPAKVAACKWRERIVTFLFKYRPLDLLRANGIAPPPSNWGKRKASPECKSDHDDSDAEEARILEDRLNEIKAKRAEKKIKKRKFKEEENVDPIDFAQPTKRTKREEKPVFMPGEIIDLT